MQCGIMDQFAIARGKADNAIIAQLRYNLDYTYILLNWNNYRLLILNSKKPRSLISFKIQRAQKSESDEALRILQATSSIRNLCEATFPQLDLIRDENN